MPKLLVIGTGQGPCYPNMTISCTFFLVIIIHSCMTNYSKSKQITFMIRASCGSVGLDRALRGACSSRCLLKLWTVSARNVVLSDAWTGGGATSNLILMGVSRIWFLGAVVMKISVPHWSLGRAFLGPVMWASPWWSSQRCDRLPSMGAKMIERKGKTEVTVL